LETTPDNSYNAFVEDCIVDLYIAYDPRLPENRIDGIQEVERWLPSQLTDLDVSTIQRIAVRVYNSFELHLLSVRLEPTDRLFQVLSLARQRDKSDLPFITVTTQGDQRLLSARIPRVDPNNAGQIENLGHLLRFAGQVLGIHPTNVRTYEDPTVGEGLTLQANINRTITLLSESCTSPEGMYPGEIVNFENSFKGNLVDMIAALRLLRKYQPVIRKRVARHSLDEIRKLGHTPKKYVSSVNQNILIDTFNTHAGLKSEMQPYVKSFIKAVLTEVTKSRSFFPGGWNFSLKRHNGVSSLDGVIARLGYEPSVPYFSKVEQIFSESMVTLSRRLSNGSVQTKTKIVTATKETPLTFRESRALASIALPYFSDDDKRSVGDQLKLQPLKVASKNTLRYFERNPTTVDDIEIAYAVKSAVSKKKQSASDLHKTQAHQRLVNDCSQPKYEDRCGKTYKDHRDFPERFRNYLEKVLFATMTVDKITEASEETADAVPDAPTGDGGSASIQETGKDAQIKEN
jgi:hypothetical protein